MSKIYYISDLHLLHENNVKEIDSSLNLYSYIEKLITNWNSKVTVDDTVYVVGDVAVSARFRILTNSDLDFIVKVLNKLNGKKYLLTGNHDEEILDTKVMDCFEEVSGYKRIQDNEREVILCHYPILDWNLMGKSYMLHGHLHTRFTQNYLQVYFNPKSKGRLINCGMYLINMIPRTLDELYEIQKVTIDYVVNNIGDKEHIYVNNFRPLDVDKLLEEKTKSSTNCFG